MKFIGALLLLSVFSAQAQEFPKDFTGHWKGELAWYQMGKGDPQKVAMQLQIQQQIPQTNIPGKLFMANPARMCARIF
jgi:hypothetical protein